MGSHRILVTGANGFLGQNLVSDLLNNSFEVIGTGKGNSRLSIAPQFPFTYSSLDLLDGNGLEKLFSETRPIVVVHAGAITQVDQCELSREGCYQVNVMATKKILELAEDYGAFFIFISTDFVFDGEKGNYTEDDPLAPVNWYGQTKMEAEIMVGQLKIPWAIVRTCLVYGDSAPGSRLNIITWVRSHLQKGERIRVVDDQFRTPTYVEDLARGIARIIGSQSRGIFHISGDETLTPYHMAVKTANYCGLDAGLIEKVNAQSFTQTARRPARTGFRIDKARSILGFNPTSFDAAIDRVFRKSIVGEGGL